VPWRLAAGGIECGEGDGDRVEGQELGFVAIRTRSTLGSRGWDCDTGQRDENS
jgi:hypothetical protein